MTGRRVTGEPPLLAVVALRAVRDGNLDARPVADAAARHNDPHDDAFGRLALAVAYFRGRLDACPGDLEATTALGLVTAAIGLDRPQPGGQLKR